MPYGNQITRTGADPLIPQGVIDDIVQSAPEQSAVLRLATRLPNMTSAQSSMPVLAALPTAYWVDGDNGLKQTTEMAWAKKLLVVAELAVIVPIPEAVLDDSNYDIWGQVKPRIVEQMGKKIDQAILLNVGTPTIWPSGILVGATAAGQTVSHAGFTGDYYDEILGPGGTLSMVEEDGFMVSGHVSSPTMKARLRGLRDTTGQPIFMRSMQEAGQYELDGEPMEFIRDGAWDDTKALMISGDFKQIVYAIRQDMTFKISGDATIQDGAGNIIYNMFQQDMVAMRCVFRMAWQLPNPLTSMNTNDSTRYPFAALVP